MYNRCGIAEASTQVLNARWRLFGHTLRMDELSPARKAMAYYFVGDMPGRQGNRTTIASTLSNEYRAVTGKSISSRDEYEDIVQLAQNREGWKSLVEQVVLKQSDLHLLKAQKATERRHQAKHMCGANYRSL